MRYFLVKLQLEINGNVVKYIRPDWYINAGLTDNEVNYTDTTLADIFVDVVCRVDDTEMDKIKALEDNGALELNITDFENWERYKQTILQLNIAKDNI